MFLPLITNIRKEEFTEAARMAYAGGCAAGAGTILPIDNVSSLWENTARKPLLLLLWNILTRIRV